MNLSLLAFGAVLAHSALTMSAQGVAKPVISASPDTAQPSASAPPPQTSIQTSVQPAGTTATPAAPGQTPGTAPSVSPVTDPTRYIIGLEDTLQVTVWKEPSLSGSIPVRPDGMISLALLGDVAAAGRTPMVLGDEITARLKKFLTDPNVTVTVVGVHSKVVYLIGEVGHVGALALTPDMTPLQAIAAAGGLSAFADAKHIYILRGEAGKQKKIPFNYKTALKTGNQQGVTLAAGDTIVIP